MKIIKYLSLVLAVALTVSCEKNVIEYNTTPITDMAEFQLHYMVPVVTSTANNITRIEANGQLIANSKATLSTYNVVPGGTSAGRFYAVNPGNVNLKMYMTAKLEPKGDSLVYDQSVTLAKGKQNVFVHAFDKAPVLFDNGFPYTARETVTTDSTAWIKFYNFLYDTINLPTIKRIQYQYVDSRSGARVNIGAPVAFGETTGWIPVTVVKSVAVSAGSRLITFKMQEVNASGTVIGDLQVMGTTGIYAPYEATATLFIGRRYHHTMAGFLKIKSPNSSVRVFTAL